MHDEHSVARRRPVFMPTDPPTTFEEHAAADCHTSGLEFSLAGEPVLGSEGMIDSEPVGPDCRPGLSADMSSAEDYFAGDVRAVQLQRSAENAVLDEQVTVDLCPGTIQTWRRAPGQPKCLRTSAGQLGPFLQPAVNELKQEGNLPVGEIKTTGDPRASKSHRRHGARVQFPGPEEQAGDYPSPDGTLRSPFGGMGEIVPNWITRAQVHRASQREAGTKRPLGPRWPTRSRD